MTSVGGTMGAVLYCPECRHEVFIDRVRPVNCGICKVRFNRNVAMVVDDRAGDLRRETEKADESGLWTP